MCDCYDHQCEVCEETIPMHIGDYAYPRIDFQVWCAAHLDQAAPGSVVFTVTDSDDYDYPDGWRCGIYGPEVGGGGDNHPNIAADFAECRT